MGAGGRRVHHRGRGRRWARWPRATGTELGQQPLADVGGGDPIPTPPRGPRSRDRATHAQRRGGVARPWFLLRGSSDRVLNRVICRGHAMQPGARCPPGSNPSGKSSNLATLGRKVGSCSCGRHDLGLDGRCCGRVGCRDQGDGLGRVRHDFCPSFRFHSVRCRSCHLSRRGPRRRARCTAQGREEAAAEALDLARPDTLDGAQRRGGVRPRAHDRRELAVREQHVGRHALFPRGPHAPFPQVVEQRALVRVQVASGFGHLVA
jgi:hypothetical protein